jgi:molybdopterin-binding protein
MTRDSAAPPPAPVADVRSVATAPAPPGASRSLIELDDVEQRYGERTVLRIPSLRVRRGARLAVIGPNGSGKTTLLRLVAFLEPAAAGTVRFDGAVVREPGERRRARLRATLVEQRPFLFRGTVLDNVAWGVVARGRPRAAAEAAGRAALALLRSDSLADRRAGALSEGEIQRVAVARALAVEPDLLVLDEPASGADRAAQHALEEAIAAAQARRSLTVVAASHQLEDAYRWADDLLVLHEGTPTPVSPENLFRVELAGGSGIQAVTIRGVAIEVLTDRAGPATLAIPPDEIVLSREPLHSSARNTLTGRVVRVAEQGQAMRVTIDAGLPLVALVTRRSFEDLGLGVGAAVVASFKSVAVRVF